MSKTEYKNGKAYNLLGTIEIDSLVGDFSNFIEKIKKEEAYYTDEYINKEGKVSALFADSKSYNAYSWNYAPLESRNYKFDRIYLEYNQLSNFDREYYQLQVYGERPISPEEQKGLEDYKTKIDAEKTERDRKEFERLKKQFSE